MDALTNNDLTKLVTCYEESKGIYEWSVGECVLMREKLPEDPKYYAFYNDVLNDQLLRLEGTVEEMGLFMGNAVEYLWQPERRQTAALALQAFKAIVSSPTVKRYLDYCD